MLPSDQQLLKNKIMKWHIMQAELKKMKKEEMELRKEIVSCVFPQINVGQNYGQQKFRLWDNQDLVTTVYPNYSVDEAAFYNYGDEMAVMKIPDNLIIEKLELNKKVYAQLTKDQKLVCDLFVTIKPGAPSLDIHPIVEGGNYVTL